MNTLLNQNYAMKNKISLVIPVYNGGSYLKECLDSIAKNKSVFFHVYISINKSKIQEKDISIVENFIHENSDFPITYYVQKKMLSAVSHSNYFFSRIIKDDFYSDYFMILCHDDVLSKECSKILQEIDNALNCETVINPARSLYKESFLEENYIGTYYGLKSYKNLRISKERFTMQCFDHIPETNISGIILPKNAFIDFRNISKNFAYGYRTEYIMFFLKSIKYIQGTNSATVYIRKHKNSEGAKWFPKEGEYDEIFYRTYLFYATEDKYLEYFKNKLIFSRLLHLIRINRNLFFIFKNKKKYIYIITKIFHSAIHKILQFLKQIVKFFLQKLHLWNIIKKCIK